MPDSEPRPITGRSDQNNMEILQHINAMIDSPLDLGEGLPGGSPDGKVAKFYKLICHRYFRSFVVERIKNC